MLQPPPQRLLNACTRSYERLEYVGDALLSLVVAQHDLTANPLADEGQLRSVHRLLTAPQCRECAFWHARVAL
jgi:dsRNA-specific ribonuclease